MVISCYLFIFGSFSGVEKAEFRDLGMSESLSPDSCSEPEIDQETEADLWDFESWTTMKHLDAILSRLDHRKIEIHSMPTVQYQPLD